MLLPKYSPILKPQNQISEKVKASAINEIKEWFKSCDLPDYQAHLLASEIIDRVISEQIRRTASSAPSVHVGARMEKGSKVMWITHSPWLYCTFVQ